MPRPIISEFTLQEIAEAEPVEHELSRRQEVAQRDLEHDRRAACTETDAITGELKRLSAYHRETKEMLADRQSEVAQLTELKAQLEG